MRTNHWKNVGAGIMKRIDTDILIVGTGAAGLFAALHADPDKKF